MSEPVQCPACGGWSQPGSSGGWLDGWRHGNGCSLRAAEDRRRLADLEAAGTGWHRAALPPFDRSSATAVQREARRAAEAERVRWSVRPLRRPATDTERVLLTVLGCDVPDLLDTDLSGIRRSWPQLELTEGTPR